MGSFVSVCKVPELTKSRLRHHEKPDDDDFHSKFRSPSAERNSPQCFRRGSFIHFINDTIINAVKVTHFHQVRIQRTLRHITDTDPDQVQSSVQRNAIANIQTSLLHCAQPLGTYCIARW